ncbi:MAG: multiheme c-type cytochrome [Coriobacteriia bacterium]|nr:multiheme c-type cytochrome [Coriobacteriia bacterium]
MKHRAVVALAVVLALTLGVGATMALAQGVPVEKGNAKPEDFPPVVGCGCHSALIDQWSKSMHAQALTDPLYLSKLAEGQKATDGALGAFCNKCHGPAATMTGEIGNKQLSAGVAGGVNCTWCHQAVGNAGEPANVSQLVVLDGVRRAQIKDPQAPHPAQYSAFHESAEICGGCHNVNHPVNGMHLEATYTEWQKSPWAAEGVTCQDCHMSKAPGEIGPFTGQAAGGAPERDNLYAMTFTGAQVELGDPVLATAMLQSAATVKLEAPEILASGSSDVTVTITNVGAGHYLPTGLTEIREMWLEVYTVDEAGAKAVIGEHMFGTILEDAEGNSPAELWDAVKIKSDDRIPPRESVTDKFSFTMPAGAEQTTLTAALFYRSAPEEMAKKAGLKNPTTEMAKATQVVYASEQAQLQAAKTDVGQGKFFDGLNLFVALAGLAVVAGIVFWFTRRKRTA